MFNSKIFCVVFVLFMVLLSGCEKSNHSFYVEKGTTLYLQRVNYSEPTKRAVFNYTGDCDLIAKNMNIAEPRAIWFCK